MRHTIRTLVAALSLFWGTGIAETVTSDAMGYSVELPDDWTVLEVIDTTYTADGTMESIDTIHIFEDASNTYTGLVGIRRYDYSSDAVFTSESDWTRANFIAYKFAVEADPFSVLIFYDTVTVKHNNALWATDAYSHFYSIDSTLSDWAEYIRFTALGTNGYEIYALGEMGELDTNIVVYAEIMNSIVLSQTDVDIAARRPVKAVTSAVVNMTTGITVNLLGRSIVQKNRTKLSTQLLLQRRRTIVEKKCSLY